MARRISPVASGSITGPYIVMLALMVLIVALLALEYWEQRSRDTIQPFAAVPRTASFANCGSGRRVNCVVDGDTFWFRGQKIRILDIDTPELSPPRCAEEERLGRAAKRRLRELLNGGEVTLVRGLRDRDRYGRLLRRTYVDGHSIGAMLISEGLARAYGSRRRSWCG